MINVSFKQFTQSELNNSLGKLTFCRNADPVQVASEFLGDVRLPPGRQSNHHDHRRGVAELRHGG